MVFYLHVLVIVSFLSHQYLCWAVIQHVIWNLICHFSFYLGQLFLTCGVIMTFWLNGPGASQVLNFPSFHAVRIVKSVRYLKISTFPQFHFSPTIVLKTAQWQINNTRVFRSNFSREEKKILIAEGSSTASRHPFQYISFKFNQDILLFLKYDLTFLMWNGSRETVNTF